MILSEKRIALLLEKGFLRNAEPSNVKNISYDLRTQDFIKGINNISSEVSLLPNESIFVGSKEIIKLPNNIVGKVVLRNSRIREGLLLTAPVYQPGHETRVFFRITNVSKNEINLNSDDVIASLMFEELSEATEKPYAGRYNKEFEFRG